MAQNQHVKVFCDQSGSSTNRVLYLGVKGAGVLRGEIPHQDMYGEGYYSGVLLSSEWQINYYLKNNPNLKVVAISAVYIGYDLPADVYVVFQDQYIA